MGSLRRLASAAAVALLLASMGIPAVAALSGTTPELVRRVVPVDLVEATLPTITLTLPSAPGLPTMGVLGVEQPAAGITSSRDDPVGALSVRELASKPAPPALPRLPAVPAVRSIAVPVLMYHYIRVNPDPTDRLGFSLSVTPWMFKAQMDYLAGNGFHVISLHDAVMAIRGQRGLPSRPIVLTFDDGYADFFTAAIPELLSRGFTATDFVVTGFVGRAGYMTWSQVQQADTMGFTIGAHTVNHIALAAASPSRAYWEMRQSKLNLEAMLGHPVLDFAYPYGSYNATLAGQARALGFETACSTVFGSWHSTQTLWTLARVRIGGGASLATFAQLLGGPIPR